MSFKSYMNEKMISAPFSVCINILNELLQHDTKKSVLLKSMWDTAHNGNIYLFFTQQSNCSPFQKHCRVKKRINSVLEAIALNKNAATDSQHFCYKQPLSYNVAVFFFSSLLCSVVYFFIRILILWVLSVCVSVCVALPPPLCRDYSCRLDTALRLYR